MLNKITGLLLLLATINGFAHETFDSVDDAPVASVDAVSSITLPVISDVIDLLDIDTATQPQKSLAIKYCSPTGNCHATIMAAKSISGWTFSTNTGTGSKWCANRTSALFNSCDSWR